MYHVMEIKRMNYDDIMTIYDNYNNSVATLSILIHNSIFIYRSFYERFIVHDYDVYVVIYVER